MMIKIAAALVALFLLFGIPLVPAQAYHGCPDTYCNDIRHYAPDDGYDAPFLAQCKAWTSSGGAYAYNFYIYEGKSGHDHGCPDVQLVYVYDGKQIACFNGERFVVKWDATGWHEVGHWWQRNGTYLCVHQLD